MKHENEFRFILDLVCEHLQTLPEGTARVAVTAHATLCLTMIEMALKDGTEPSGDESVDIED